MAGLNDVIKNFNKKAAEEIVTIGLPTYDYVRVPFTSPRLNYCTYGGLAKGRIAEFHGEEHGGKTTTALDVVANHQKMFPDQKILYVDAENTLDPDWARLLGVDTESLILLQPQEQPAEELFQFICDAVETGEIGMWVLDSIGVLMSQQAWEKDMTEKTYAGISQSLTKFSTKIVPLCKKTQCLGLGINQVRDDLNSMWGGYKTPGGREWKHVCSMRIDFRRGSFFDAKGNDLTRSAENPAGNKVQFSIVKSKTCPSKRRTGYYTLNYDMGIDVIRDLIEVAEKSEILTKHGSWYEIIDKTTGEILKDKLHGQSEVYEYLLDHAEIQQKIEDFICSADAEE